MTASGTKDLEVARRVLLTERDGLQALADGLDQTFIDAVEALASVKGRVIVTGMGKSGHMARKIAATMASTGTPAFFVHPGEASHGDLGMITRDDALLVLSNSGETAELGDIIAHADRFSITMIGIASRPESRLLNSADIGLVLPPVPEACSVGMAPTTSTTMTLALGDALAVALMERKGFTAEDFRTFHPGGKLGSAMMRVSELMHSNDLPLTTPDASMADVLLVMTSSAFGAAGIVDDGGALVGIITDGDLRRHLKDDGGASFLGLTAGQVMTANPRTIDGKSLVAKALGVMNDKQITCLFVLDEAGKPKGLLHIHDCLRAGFV